MIPSDRKQAFQILNKILSKKISLAQLPADCTPFSQALCYGVCRYYYRLECIADHLLKKRPKKQEIWILLLLGLFELYHLEQPEYAVVKTYVDLVPAQYAFAKGLINASLRQYCRSKEIILETLQQTDPFRFNHPAWLIKRLQSFHPEWETVLAENDKHPPMTLRVNRLKVSQEAYLNLLKTAGINAHPHPEAPDALILKTPCDIKTLPEFNQGFCSVQDAAAQLAVSLLAPKPDSHILDACCAPGGKTTHLLEYEPNLSKLTALDIEDHRMNRVKENLKRLHFNTPYTLITADALALKTWWDKKYFDSILLDAPCSATGVIRRHPDIKYLRTEADLQPIQDLQKKLLNTLWSTLANAGRLLYITCSILPEENDQQIADFLKNHPDAQSIPISFQYGHRTDHGWQIFPGEGNMDGFFYSLLEKNTKVSF